MSSLRRAITDLADQFVTSILDTVRGASLHDLTGLDDDAPAARRGRRRPATVATESKAAPKRAAALPRTRKGARRSKADQQKIVDAVVTALGTAAEGLSSEQLQRSLGIAKKDLQRPIARALAAKAIKKKGIKQATRYFPA